MAPSYISSLVFPYIPFPLSCSLDADYFTIPPFNKKSTGGRGFGHWAPLLLNYLATTHTVFSNLDIYIVLIIISLDGYPDQCLFCRCLQAAFKLLISALFADEHYYLHVCFFTFLYRNSQRDGIYNIIQSCVSESGEPRPRLARCGRFCFCPVGCNDILILWYVDAHLHDCCLKLLMWE